MTVTSTWSAALPRADCGAVTGEGASALDAVWARLQSLVNWEKADRAGMRVDLAPEVDLLARLGNPHRRFKAVHVAGTKGKGTVCALIEAGLLHAGLRAGRYASPHVERVTERVSHFGHAISESALALALTQALDARDAACQEATPAGVASWFDVVTAAALWSFAEARLEWAVIEVGLGGLLDSTNVVTPDLAIVTNVGLEHTEILGATLPEIAAQKAGIVKKGRPVLTPLPRSDPAGQVVWETAEAQGADCTWTDLNVAPGLVAGNVALARAALARLGRGGVQSRTRGLPLDEHDLPDAVAGATRLPGRLELVDVVRPSCAQGNGRGRVARFVLDGAHVGFALSAVLEELRRSPTYAPDPIVLLALGADKNAEDMVARLRGVASRVLCTRLPGNRSCWPASELARICISQGIPSECVDEPLTALSRCSSLVPDDSWVLVTGSLYLVGAVRPELRRRQEPYETNATRDTSRQPD